MKPIVACIFVVYFLMIFASLVRFYVFVMPLGGSKMLAVDVSIGPYQWLGRSPSYHEVLTPVQLLLRLQNHHRHTQAAMTTTPQTSLAMDQEKQVQSIIDQLKGHSLPDGGEIVGFINLSSSEFMAMNNGAHIARQYKRGFTECERKTTTEAQCRSGFTASEEAFEVNYSFLSAEEYKRGWTASEGQFYGGFSASELKFTRKTSHRKGITFSLCGLEDLRQYFVRKLINAVSFWILLAICLVCLVCSKVSQLVRSSTQPSASPPLSLSEIPTPKAPEKPQVPIKKIQQAKGKGRVISENLRQYFGQKRKDVAARLRVSVSTFKRMCRQQGIMRWPGMGSSGSVSKPPDQHGERNTSTAWGTPSRNVETGMEVEPVGQPDSFEDLNFWNIEIGSIAEIPSDWDFLALEEETSLVGLVSGSVNLTVAACSDPAPRQHPMLTIPDTMTTTHMMSHLAAKGDVRFVTLKVTYGKKIIKFQFPLMSGIMELKEEVKKRLKLELDSFDVEYKDEDGDCIFLGCDEDLRNHLQHFSNQVIRLLIVDSDANTSNFR